MTLAVDGRVVVVGAGHAAGTFVALLRQAGHRGEVVVVGEEEHLPYQRPPLSKSFLTDGGGRWLRDAAFYVEQDVTMALSETVTALDLVARRATTSAGRVLAYDALVLATGARPRTLAVPGAGLGGVLALRTLDDAARLRRAVASGGPLVVVGGGYVGLEVAAVARSGGVPVTVLEREERLLARVASPALSALLEEHHRGRGSDVRTGARVCALTGEDGRLTSVLLEDGTAVEAATAVVGVGAVPCDELAVAAGLVCDGGVLVDAASRTSDPSVLAIGDVTRRPRRGADGLRVRLESIPSATEQARQAVHTLLGRPVPELEVPWFWSDQFDLRLKTAGVLEAPYATALRGDPATGSFALLHHRDGRLLAVETANANGDFMAARRLLADDRRVDPALLDDPTVPLRDLALAPA